MLDADTNVTRKGSSTVDKWLDGSGSANDLQSLGNPKIVSHRTPAGKSAIVFDGVGDRLQRVGNLAGVPAGSRNRTVLAVLNYVDTNGVSAGVSYGQAADNRAFGLVADGETDSFSVDGFGSDNNLSSSIAATSAGWVVQSAMLSDGELSHYVDGELVDNWTHSYDTLTDAGDSALVIGGEIGQATSSKMEISALLIYDRALLPDELSLMHAYLVDQYLDTGESPALTGFSDELVADNLNQPIALDFLPDGRMLILEKGGQIWIADPNSGARQPYLQLQNIDSAGERGLLEIAVHPDFDPAVEGTDFIYVYYTPATPRKARIARFAHTDESGGLTSHADQESETIIWEDTDGYLSCCHFGGGLDFGPDGKLWLTTSDKFTSPNPGEGLSDLNISQDLDLGGGKVIRVNPDGTIPTGEDGWPANPFIDPVDDDPGVEGNQDYHDFICGLRSSQPFSRQLGPGERTVLYRRSRRKRASLVTRRRAYRNARQCRS